MTEDLDAIYRLHQGADEAPLYAERSNDLRPRTPLEWYAVAVAAGAAASFLVPAFVRVFS